MNAADLIFVDVAESAYDDLARKFNYQISKKIPLIYYATHSAFAICVHRCAVACSAVSMLVNSFVAHRYSGPTWACAGLIHVSSNGISTTMKPTLRAEAIDERQFITPLKRTPIARPSREPRARG